MFLTISESAAPKDRRFVTILVSVALTLFLAFIAASEVLIRVKVEPRDLLLQHVQFMAKIPGDKVVIGDSHATLGFTGQAGISNIAFPGENFATSLTKIEAFFATHKPGLVILQVSPHQFRDQRNDGVTRDYRHLGSGEMNLRVLSPWHGPQILEYWRTFLQGKDFGTQRVFESDGAQTTKRRLSDLAPAERENAAQQIVPGQVPPANMTAVVGTANLRQLLDRLAELGARVCLVTFPVSPDYRALAVAHPEFDHARRFIATLARERGLNYADMWSSVDDNKLFDNPDHLNRQGALTVAPVIAKDCGA